MCSNTKVDVTGVKCEFCNSDNANETICPYTFEIYNETCKITVCDDCLGEISDEI